MISALISSVVMIILMPINIKKLNKIAIDNDVLVYIGKNEKENKRDREVRDNQIANLKELTNYIQSLQDKDIDTLTSVLESDKDIASRLTLETSTEKMLEPTHTLSYWRNHHWKED